MSLAEVKELKSPVKKWVPAKKQLFINGKWIDAKSGKTFDGVSRPSNDQYREEWNRIFKKEENNG